MKTGILGGTFDPVHNAHLMIAQKAYEEFALDKVLFMPSPCPPHKNETEITSTRHRVKMVQLAIEDYDYFEFSDFELAENGNVYSADTLCLYQKEHPDEELYFIIGSDSLYTIDSWYHPEIIFQTAHILVAKRDDNSGEALEEKIKFLKKNYDAKISQIIVKASDISSTKIRQTGNHMDLSGYVPEKVGNYIKENSLYTDYKGSKRMTNAEIIADLKKTQNRHRFEHTMGVAKTAKKMAEVLGENPNKAYLAGLLHDCAKCISDEEKIKICKENSIEISASEKCNPFLLHAKAGAYFTQYKYHITDTDIINAVRYHTTGRPDMSLLEKIIFTADYIEPGRNKQPNLEELRKSAYLDIDFTVYMILRDTLNYLETKGQENIDGYTKDAFLFYKKLIDKRK